MLEKGYRSPVLSKPNSDIKLDVFRLIQLTKTCCSDMAILVRAKTSSKTDSVSSDIIAR